MGPAALTLFAVSAPGGGGGPQSGKLGFASLSPGLLPAPPPIPFPPTSNCCHLPSSQVAPKHTCNCADRNRLTGACAPAKEPVVPPGG